MVKDTLLIKQVKISDLKPATYNPRKWSKEATEQLVESIRKYGLVEPLLANSAPERLNVLIGGHFRLKVAKGLGYKEAPVVYVNIPDLEQEKELNLRLNKNLGDWDYSLLAEFDSALLDNIGFSSNELDDIFTIDIDEPENFDLAKELKKLKIDEVTVQHGDIFKLGESRLMVGDSTKEEDIRMLMNGQLADMCLTDPPYILDYGGAQRQGKPVTTSGASRKRRYLETESLPDDFTEKWMTNIATVANKNFSIIVYENWKNLRVIWSEMEKHFSVKNMLVWHIPNRYQNFSSKYRFFSKHDIAMIGANGDVEYNYEQEEVGMQEEYETALYAISGKPHWEDYDKKRILPTDFIESDTDDLKNSGQGIIFGTKPLDILIPYIKVLTKRGDLLVEPFCGSGSTLVAATKLKRRCYTMEKSPIYAEVALRRWEKLTGLKREKIDDEQTSSSQKEDS